MSSTVLIVEAYADLRAGIVSTLQHHAYACDAVGSVADAEHMLREHDYSYVVVDLDSRESNELVSTFDADANVILISDADPRDARANDFAMLRKPFSRDELLAQFAR